MAGWPYDPPKGGRSEHHRQHTNKASFNQGSSITWPGYSERSRRVRHDRDRKHTPYQEAKERIRKRRSSETAKHYQMQRKENGNTNSEHDEIRYCQSIEVVLDGIDFVISEERDDTADDGRGDGRNERCKQKG